MIERIGENDAQVSMADNIDVHHIFPSSYIEKEFNENSEEYDFSNSILNKIRTVSYTHLTLPTMDSV